jgi:hypothetical protein
MKTFVDNVCRQVIERHIVGKLDRVFFPTSVLQFSDEDVERIASEPTSKLKRMWEKGFVPMAIMACRRRHGGMVFSIVILVATIIFKSRYGNM